MILPSETRFVDENIRKAFYKLKEGDKSEQEMFKFINQALDNLEKNSFCGIQIPKKQIPKEYIRNYNATNLWKYDLPNSWRLIYSIKGGKAVVVSLILEWMPHKEYKENSIIDPKTLNPFLSIPYNEQNRRILHLLQNNSRKDKSRKNS